MVCLSATAKGRAQAQPGNIMMVYSVKGTVTARYGDQSFPLKIGKVLQPGTVITTAAHSSLTLLCQRGKPVSVSQEGSYPLSKWKDSCAAGAVHSVSSNYFRYIWQHLYANSSEYKEEKRKETNLAVSRGEDPPGPAAGKPKGLYFHSGMDTVVDDGSAIPLSWTGKDIQGPYYFSLLEATGKKVLYRDTVRNSFIPLDRFRHLLTTGKTYRWTVAARSVKTSRPRVLRVVSRESAQQVVDLCLQPQPFAEDSAAQCLRVAFTLEKRHYLGAALQWYLQAAEKGPEEDLFRDQLTRFRNDYWIR